MGTADAPETGTGRPTPHPMRSETPNKRRDHAEGADMADETKTEDAKPEAEKGERIPIDSRALRS